MEHTSRRDFLKKGTLLSLAGAATSFIPSSIINAAESFNKQGFLPETNVFSLPKLPYSFEALEPHIDKLTMEIHYTKHHQAYITNLNKAIEANQAARDKSLEIILSTVSQYSPALRNNAGGHYNHSLFWTLMKPEGGGEPNGVLAESIKNTFNSFNEFKLKFTDFAMKRFGSGWTWLIVNKDKKLEICSTPNQDNPLMDIAEIKGLPILALDVWEHAYYLKHQNMRADYISSWFNVINWNTSASLYLTAIK